MKLLRSTDMILRYCTSLLVVFAASMTVSARSPDRDILTFSVTTNVGFGNSVFVVGSHPDSGAWSPTSAVKLCWTSGNAWTGRVAVQKGTALEYKFITRNMSDVPTNRYCVITNVVWEPGTNRIAQTAAAPSAPYSGKTVYYYSGWTSATLLTISGTNFPTYPMTIIGPGRNPGESLFKAEGVGEEGEWLEFVAFGFLNGNQYWDNPIYFDFNHNYYTRLDAFLLQDGGIYNYWPSNSVSSPYVITNYINSTVTAITGRNIRVYLPRGYDTHAWKRYPVIYMQDGQNVFSPGGTFGSWDGDLTATKEISQGRMRETIIVAIDNKDNRRVEYNPPGSTYPGEPTGHADNYLKFIADNVRPTLDVNFRTLTDRRNTFVGGSSMGGIFSVYAGYDTNLFGGLIAMSPSFCRAGIYTTSLYSRAKAPIRIYMDMGTEEHQVGDQPNGNYWDAPWEGYDIFIKHGFAPNDDLLLCVGCGQYHNEAAWRQRLPGAFRFILPVSHDPNRIALNESPPEIAAFVGATTVQFNAQKQIRYELEESTGGSWNQTGLTWTETNAWSHRSLSVTSSPLMVKLLRLTASPND